MKENIISDDINAVARKRKKEEEREREIIFIDINIQKDLKM
jgi:hypothetical protein